MAGYDIDALVRDPDFQGRSFAERKAILREADAEGFGTLPEAAQSRMLVDMKGQGWWQGGRSRSTELGKGAKMTPEESKDYAANRAAFESDNGETLATIKRTAKGAVKAAMPYVRPVLEGGGAAVGGIVGAGAGGLAGLAGGPAAPGTVPYGAIAGGVAGGATGYATGKYIADALEGAPQSAPQTLRDLATGATYEMGGQVGGMLAGKAITKGANTLSKLRDVASRNTPAFTKKAIDRKAGEIIAENSGTGAVYEKNAADAAKVNIPGYKPSLGELRNDPGLIKLQRGIEAMPGKASITITEQRSANQSAVRDYLENEFKGNESIDDVINALNQKKAQIGATTAQAEGQAATAKAVLNPADNQTVGRGVVDAIDEAGTPAKQQVNKMYQDLPNDPLPTSHTASAVKELEKDFRPGDEDVFPSRAIARVKEALQGPKPSTGGHGKPADPVILDAFGKPVRDTVDTTKSQVGFQDLHSLRKDLGRQIQDAMSGAQPNRELAMKLRRLKDAVDADIDAGMGNGAKSVVVDDELLQIAGKDTAGSKAKFEMESDAFGVIPGRQRQLDAAFERGTYSVDDVSKEYAPTREYLRSKYGNEVTLYRADALPSERSSATKTVYFGDESLAKKFATDGRVAKPYEVPVDDIVAVYARPSGYYEFIVKLPDDGLKQPVSQQYQAARQAFADYANKFRTGEVAKITQKGGQASGRNIPDALIARRVFSADGADDFINAVGKEKAAAHADQYAAQDLLSKANPLTGEIPAKTAAAWIQKNMGVLRKYGISGKYTTVAKAQAQAEIARAAEVEFTKSAASRILNADVDKAIGSAFSSNPSNTGAVIEGLMKDIGSDKQALKGLQNAFKDFLDAKIGTTAKTIDGTPVISPAAVQKELAKYAPAMRRLYANDPGKIAALKQVSKAVEIQARSAKTPAIGTSGTAENLNMARSIIGRVVDILPGGGMARGLVKAGLGKLQDLSAAELNKVIVKALYDPELAKTLVLASNRVKPALVEKQINSHLVTMGLVGTRDKDE